MYIVTHTDISNKNNTTGGANTLSYKITQSYRPRGKLLLVNSGSKKITELSKRLC